MTDERAGAAKGSPREVFWAFLGLGLTAFGGPIAHIGYFRRAFVEKRAWLAETAYADLVALCQFLPGPASSQVGFSIGLLRAGWYVGRGVATGEKTETTVAATRLDALRDPLGREWLTRVRRSTAAGLREGGMSAAEVADELEAIMGQLLIAEVGLLK